MADAEEVATLRRMVAEPTAATYSDQVLGTLIDASDSVERAASAIWTEKAASLSTLVDISESGSSRKMSDMHRNALAMAKYYSDSITVAEEVAQDVPPRTRAIERP